MADEPTTNTNGATPDAPDPDKLTPEQVEAQIIDALDTETASGERTPDQGFADSMIRAAVKLRQDQRAHVARTSANRDLLRNLKAMDVLTPTQGTAVDLLYPERTKKTRDSGAGQGSSTAADGVHVQVNPASPAAKRAAKPAATESATAS